MKKSILALLFTTYALAMGPQGGGQGREMREPPQEAITICENKSSGDSCTMQSPRGDTVEGTCEDTPDGNYFACKPENMGNNRPQNR
ncbi:MAG: hypothetical protein U9O56_06820 [Campylobacterota bacterium]|nr:hypothetical protein [Campylobacterota bacterium]